MVVMTKNLKALWATLRAVFLDTGKHMLEAQLPLVASSLAYTTILSIIPLLAVSFAIFQAFGGLEKIYEMIEPMILENLAESAGKDAMNSIRRFIGNAHGGAMGAGGLIGLVITSMSMLSSAEKAINRVWRAEIKRTLFQRIAAYWLFITLGPIALSVALGTATSSDIPLSKVLPSGTIGFVFGILIFTIIYKFVPNRKVQILPALIAGTATTITWYLAKAGYSLYTHKVVTYHKLYGSLGAIPIMLFWIYIIWLVILAGAAFSAALQKRADRFT